MPRNPKYLNPNKYKFLELYIEDINVSSNSYNNS